MYCKAITQKGTVCLNTALDKCIHCNIHNKEYDICNICYDNIYDKVTLDCGHEFCSDCMFDWKCLKGKSSCPYCRSTISDNFLNKRSMNYNKALHNISHQLYIIYNSINNEDIIHHFHAIAQTIISNRDLLRCVSIHEIMLKKLNEYSNKDIHVKSYIKFFESANEKSKHLLC